MKYKNKTKQEILDLYYEVDHNTEREIYSKFTKRKYVLYGNPETISILGLVDLVFNPGNCIRRHVYNEYVKYVNLKNEEYKNYINEQESIEYVTMYINRYAIDIIYAFRDCERKVWGNFITKDKNNGGSLKPTCVRIGQKCNKYDNYNLHDMIGLDMFAEYINKCINTITYTFSAQFVQNYKNNKSNDIKINTKIIKDINETCCICFEHPKDNVFASMPNCNHHVCVNDYRKINSSEQRKCPLCRASITESKQQMFSYIRYKEPTTYSNNMS